MKKQKSERQYPLLLTALGIEVVRVALEEVIDDPEITFINGVAWYEEAKRVRDDVQRLEQSDVYPF